MRLGLRTVVDSQADLTVVGEAGDGETAVAQASTLRPDLVLMKTRLPHLDGISATARLRTALPDTRGLVLTARDRDEYAYARSAPEPAASSTTPATARPPPAGTRPSFASRAVVSSGRPVPERRPVAA
ncbi:response regulator [Streptomyces sp. NBC_00425]|uniref:response regulator n=1 Tax=Streptomyces sp. NBC_00425 TaxID=2975740 RepID=UPI002E1FC2F1